MKSIRKYLKSISSLLAFLILFVSCEQYDSSIDDNQAINRSSGEELFKGIFFGNGNVAQKLSNFKDFEVLKAQITNEQKSAFLKLQNDLIIHINKNNPEYFENFENAINTGNQVIIRNELDSSKEFLKNSVQELTNLNYSEIEKEISMQKANFNIDLNKIETLKSKLILKGYNPGNYDNKEACVWAIAVVVAVVLWVAVVVDIIYWVQESSDSENKMEKENFINSIAQLNVHN
ncbi:MAG: hypothetical protein JKY16_07025 [Lutibacter sp.]|nr:hypothetical protein [Lutibacter sp.]